MNNTNRIGIAYVPVIHRGYLNYFEELKQQGIEVLYIISDELLVAHEELDYINRKDRIRAVPQEQICVMLKEMLGMKVESLNAAAIEDLQKRKVSIVTPYEDIGKVMIAKYFPDHEVSYSNIFLRRNELNVKEDKIPEHVKTVELSELQKKIFDKIFNEATKTADWWRRIGAALVKNGEIVSLAHNEHLPEAQLPNIEGDTRALFKKGININYVTTAHAEGAVIADAAKRGISTEGAELYVTDFPCPYCARIIAKSGIKKIYFVEGYAVLDGDDFLQGAGIELVKVVL